MNRRHNENHDDSPFVLRLSKHENYFFNGLLNFDQWASVH